MSFITIVDPLYPIIDESTDIDRVTSNKTIQEVDMILLESGEVLDLKKTSANKINSYFI